jgi:hypothetical protein
MSGFAGKFQKFLSEKVPWFLQDPNGGAFLEALGLTLDNGVQTLVTGLRQFNPLLAFVDNLPYIGNNRSIRRYPTEPVQSYRVRLQRWRQIRHFVGTHYGQMISLQPYFLPGALPRIRIVHQMGDGSRCTWHTLNPDGTYEVYRAIPSNWDWDTFAEQWSRFWVIIDVSGMSTAGAAQWDDGIADYDDGVTVWDGYLTGAKRDDIVAIINDSKAAHSTLWGVILATDPDSFDPTSTAVTDVNGATSLPIGNWGSAIDPVTGLPSRLATAAFAYDVGQGQI